MWRTLEFKWCDKIMWRNYEFWLFCENVGQNMSDDRAKNKNEAMLAAILCFLIYIILNANMSFKSSRLKNYEFW